MMTNMKNILLRCAAIATLFGLANCGTLDRVNNIGRAPALAPIEMANDTQENEGRVIVPMPAPEVPHYSPNSLWQAGARGFFKDQRAARTGDLLTVMIDITDEASLANTSTRSRAASENSGITDFLGLQSELADLMPDGFNPNSLLDADSSSSHTGRGLVNRTEEIKLTVAAIVTGILPNGNLIIRGRQEVRVNFEVRELFVAGIVRPEDISATNTIRHTQIAEARIAYGGRGQITDVQQPRYGQQFMDIVFPF